MRKHILIVLALIVIVAAGFWFWISRPDTARVPVAAVMGARPDIGAPRDQWVPTVKVADAVGWKDGQTPAAAPGLAVNAFATGLDHPRWLYRLPNGDRSEEHTSELQSLMRISYAVFCLKKKKTTTKTHI